MRNASAFAVLSLMLALPLSAAAQTEELPGGWSDNAGYISLDGENTSPTTQSNGQGGMTMGSPAFNTLAGFSPMIGGGFAGAGTYNGLIPLGETIQRTTFPRRRTR